MESNSVWNRTGDNKADDREAGVWFVNHNVLLSINHNSCSFPQNKSFIENKLLIVIFKYHNYKNGEQLAKWLSSLFQNSHQRLNLHNFTNSVS